MMSSIVRYERVSGSYRFTFLANDKLAEVELGKLRKKISEYNKNREATEPALRVQVKPRLGAKSPFRYLYTSYNWGTCRKEHAHRFDVYVYIR